MKTKTELLYIQQQLSSKNSVREALLYYLWWPNPPARKKNLVHFNTGIYEDQDPVDLPSDPMGPGRPIPWTPGPHNSGLFFSRTHLGQFGHVFTKCRHFFHLTCLLFLQSFGTCYLIPRLLKYRRISISPCCGLHPAVGGQIRASLSLEWRIGLTRESSQDALLTLRLIKMSDLILCENW